MRRLFASLVVLVAIVAFSMPAYAFKMNAELPVKFEDAKVAAATVLQATFADGALVGAWKSLEAKVARGTGSVLWRFAYDGEKLACVQTEFVISMNDFMTYDWYAYGEYHGKVLNAATKLPADKLADAYNKLMDEIYGKIMGQYRREIYYMTVDGVQVGVKLMTAKGMLNIYYFLNEPMFNGDGTARTDVVFFEFKPQ